MLNVLSLFLRANSHIENLLIFHFWSIFDLTNIIEGIIKVNYYWIADFLSNTWLQYDKITLYILLGNL